MGLEQDLMIKIGPKKFMDIKSLERARTANNALVLSTIHKKNTMKFDNFS